MKITRSAFIAALATPLALFGAAVPAHREFFANFRDDEFNHDAVLLIQSGAKLFLDGKEIAQAWYINTLTGVVRSYDIYQNGGSPLATQSGWQGAFNIRHARELGTKIKGALVEDVGGVLSITLRGRIELFSATGERLY